MSNEIGCLEGDEPCKGAIAAVNGTNTTGTAREVD